MKPKEGGATVYQRRNDSTRHVLADELTTCLTDRFGESE